LELFIGQAYRIRNILAEVIENYAFIHENLPDVHSTMPEVLPGLLRRADPPDHSQNLLEGFAETGLGGCDFYFF
jgi:hypothetical protein